MNLPEMSASEFENLTPFRRGLAVYLMGADDSQPNVPDEGNPYEEGTWERGKWDEGNAYGAMLAQDDP